MLTTINPLVNRDNLIVNPCMRWWQRDVSFDSTHPYASYLRGGTADRWFINDGYTGTATVDRQSLALLTDPMANETPNSQFYLDFGGSSPGDEFDYLYQSIELNTNGHQAMVGKWFTLSFWAKTDTGNPTMMASLRRYYNEDNWADGGTDVAIKRDFTLTTSWQKFDFTFKMPVITASPSTIKNPVLRVEFFRRLQGTEATSYSKSPFDSSSFDLHITNLKLEHGTKATPLRYDQNTDYYHCLRYFQKTYPVDTPLGSLGIGGHYLVDLLADNSAIAPLGNPWIIPTRFQVIRALGGTPSNSRLRSWSVTSTTIDQTYGMNNGVARAVTGYDASPTSFFITVTGTQTTHHQVHWALDADFWF